MKKLNIAVWHNLTSTDIMDYLIDIQKACKASLPVSDHQLEQWAIYTLKSQRPKAELTLRFVDKEEMIDLNHTYRQQNKATNVLAFPASYPSTIELDFPLIGDVIICPDVLKTESEQLNITLEAHWAHIVIHGILHLLGYDHIEEEDAEIMRPLEVKLLKKLGFTNPYKEDSFE